MAVSPVPPGIPLMWLSCWLASRLACCAAISRFETFGSMLSPGPRHVINRRCSCRVYYAFILVHSVYSNPASARANKRYTYRYLCLNTCRSIILR